MESAEPDHDETGSEPESNGKDPLKPKSVGSIIQLSRRNADLSRDEVSKLAGIPKATLARYENDSGRDAGRGSYDLHALARILDEIAKKLGIDPDVLWRSVIEIVNFQNEARYALDQIESVPPPPRLEEPRRKKGAK